MPLPSTADHLRRCDPEDQLAMAFAAKSFKAVDQMQQQRRVSLCRVISGTLKIGNCINIYFCPLYFTHFVQKPKHQNPKSKMAFILLGIIYYSAHIPPNLMIHELKTK
jgi:hypothetical protein